MRTKHLVKRGSRFLYRCRVPVDLLHHFPSPTIWKTLSTDNEKTARLSAAVLESKTQQIFLTLRLGMLSKELEKHIIAEYLRTGVEALMADTQCRPVRVSSSQIPAIGKRFSLEMRAEHEMRGYMTTIGKAQGCSAEEIRSFHTDRIDNEIARLREDLSNKSPDMFSTLTDMEKLTEQIQKKHDMKVSASDQKALALQLIGAKIKLLEAEKATLRGEWTPLELLQEKVQRDLATPYVPFQKVLEDYGEWYRASKPTVKPGTITDMEVECRVLLEIRLFVVSSGLSI